MGVGSGLGSSVGIGVESTYGTYAAPTKFLEGITKPEAKKVKNTQSGGGLVAGRMVAPGARRVVTTKAGAGALELEVSNRGFGVILAHLLGGSAAPVQQAVTTAYLQTHPLADNVGKSLSVQAGVPDTGGTPQPYTLLGAKLLSGEFSCGVDELLTCKAEVDARDLTEAQPIAAPSYVTGVKPFHFGQMAVKVGAFGSEASVSGVTKVTVKFERPQKVDRFYAGAAGLKDQPIMNDLVKITGTIETDFVDKTTFADRFAADTAFSLVWEFVGPIIASPYAETFRLTMPMCFLDGDTPTVDGNDVVAPKFPFTAYYDGTNAAISAQYLSTDTVV